MAEESPALAGERPEAADGAPPPPPPPPVAAEPSLCGVAADDGAVLAYLRALDVHRKTCEVRGRARG
jgi:hypothetical protein